MIDTTDLSSLLDSLLGQRNKYPYGSFEYVMFERCMKALGGNIGGVEALPTDKAWELAANRGEPWLTIAPCIEASENTGDWKNYKQYRMTKTQAEGRVKFEQLSPAEKDKMGRGSYTSTRTHVDGRVVDEKGNTLKQPVVPPEHRDGFIEWLEEERKYVIEVNGMSDVAIKNKVYEHLIQMVKEGESSRAASQLGYNYDQYRGWLYGHWTQARAGGVVASNDAVLSNEFATAVDAVDPQDQQAIRDVCAKFGVTLDVVELIMPNQGWKPVYDALANEVDPPSRPATERMVTNFEKNEDNTHQVPQSLIDTVYGYYDANKHRKDRNYGENWLRVLIAFGEEVSSSLEAFTASEAWKSVKVWHGWRPIAEALDKLEQPFTEAAERAESTPAETPPDVPVIQEVTLEEISKKNDFDNMLTGDDPMATPPELVSKELYLELVEEQKELFAYLKSIQPVLEGKVPPPPVLLEVVLFPRRAVADTTWLVFVAEHPSVMKNGADAWRTCVQYLHPQKGGRKRDQDIWAQASQGGRGVPVEPRFAKWQRGRATYIDKNDRKWKSVLPYGRYNRYLHCSIVPVQAGPDGQYHLRFYNLYNAYRGAKSEFVDHIVDPGPMDAHRGLKKAVFPVDLADALDDQDWDKVAQLAAERAKLPNGISVA